MALPTGLLYRPTSDVGAAHSSSKRKADARRQRADRADGIATDAAGAESLWRGYGWPSVEVATAAVLAVVLVVGLREAVSASVALGWWTALTGISAARLGLARLYRPRRDAEARREVPGQGYVVAVCLAGLAWGACATALLAATPAPGQGVVVLALAALLVVAAASLAAEPRALAGHLVGAGLPLMLWLGAQGEVRLGALAAVTALFLAAVWVAARRSRDAAAASPPTHSPVAIALKKRQAADGPAAADNVGRERAERTLAWEKQVLEMVAAHAGLTETLDAVNRGVETQFPDTRSSILLIDDDERGLVVASAPSLPAEFVSELGTMSLGPGASCYAAAVRRRKAIVAQDIAADPLWESHRDVALRHGIQACWTVPIYSPRQHALGVCAVYSGERRKPRAGERRFMERITYLAGIAIDRVRAQRALRCSELRFRDFAETAADWFWETDAQTRYTYLSGRYQQITGMACAEALGRTPVEVLAKGGVAAVGAAKIEQFMAARRPFEDCLVERPGPEGAVRALRMSGKPIFDEQGCFSGYRGSGRDASRAHVAAETLAYRANHDALTGAVNRHVFEQRLERAVRSARDYGREHVVCYIDLDRLKLVNDTLGHKAGDEVLRQVAGWLSTRVRARDTLARLGGDEFALLLENCPASKGVEIAERLVDTLPSQSFAWERHTFDIGLSIGVVPFGPEARSAVEVLALADAACYGAKRQGGGRVNLQRVEADDTDGGETDGGEGGTVAAIDVAVLARQNRLLLYAQPIRSLRPDADGVEWYEVLLKVADRQGRLLSTRAFIRAAEQQQRIVAIDRWVIRTVLQSYAARVATLPLVRFSINISGASLSDRSLMDYLGRQLARQGIAPGAICFEITETAAIRNLADAARSIAEFKKLGCRFALDDFGTGLSSFAYLKHLPVDYLKIDGSFVRDISAEAAQGSIAAAIHQMSRTLGLKTVAEWADSEAVVARLRELGVDYAQGAAVGEAVALDALTQYLDGDMRAAARG